MNFIDAVLARGALTFADGRRLTLPNGCPRPDVDKTVVLGIRPTHIGLSADAAPKPGIVRESIVVDLVQPTGARSFVSFRLGGSTVTAEVEAHEAARPGETMHVDIDLNRAVLIDPETNRVMS